MYPDGLRAEPVRLPPPRFAQGPLAPPLRNRQAQRRIVPEQRGVRVIAPAPGQQQHRRTQQFALRVRDARCVARVVQMLSEERRDETVLLGAADGSKHWWTFAGMAANTWLAIGLGDLAAQVRPGDLSVRLSSVADPSALIERLAHLAPDQLHLSNHIADGALDRLKFAEALPEELARWVVERRMRVDQVVRAVADRKVRLVTAA